MITGTVTSALLSSPIRCGKDLKTSERPYRIIELGVARPVMARLDRGKAGRGKTGQGKAWQG